MAARECLTSFVTEATRSEGIECWAYLAVLLDLYSRRVVGWALRKSLNRELAVSALKHALTSRKPPLGLVHHTDRGSQYASGEYRQLLAQHGAACSMSAAGNCYDNAVAESFFATLKKELVHGCAFETRSEAYDAISDYVENYYNASGAIRPPETNRPSTSSWPIPVGLRHGHTNNLSGISGDLQRPPQPQRPLRETPDRTGGKPGPAGWTAPPGTVTYALAVAGRRPMPRSSSAPPQTSISSRGAHYRASRPQAPL
jgi:hypothetical protein